MSMCAVVGCSAKSLRDNLSFFRIPAILTQGTKALNDLSRKRREAWISAIRRVDFTEKKAKYQRVCSKHFVSGRPSSLQDVSDPDWAPSLDMGYHNRSNIISKTAVERHERLKRRSADKVPRMSAVFEVTNDDTAALSHDEEVIDVENCSSNSKECQTDKFGADIEKNQLELRNCYEIIHNLREKLNYLAFTKETFTGDDEKTNYFTGVPTANYLYILFDKIEDLLPSHQNRALTKFDKFIIVLIKMRLNFPFKYLAYRFNVALFTLSDNFYACLNVMSQRLKPLIAWPNKGSLLKTETKTFGDKIAVILYCFELLTVKPSDCLKSRQLWSTIKQHYSVKFLFGITPQGAISFVSKAWGGHVSDKFLTENCGILEKLLPGDVVLAYRGLLINEEVRMRQADVMISAYTKGKTQLDPLDVEQTQNLADVRINLDKVIRFLKKFAFFRDPIPVFMLAPLGSEHSVIEEIVHVAAGIINICATPVPNS